MLASVPIGYLWLAALAAILLAWALVWVCIPVRKVRVLWPIVFGGVGGLFLLVFHLKGYSVASGLVMYAGGQVALAVSALPMLLTVRRFMHVEGADPARPGIVLPLWQRIYLLVCMTVLVLGAAALSSTL
ncbi:hypothetical protein [Streptomyces sp. NPDC086838]|uniref:hypothetical protein n=1 Tax=Streptomyces sp. NPDC086838 TaxID=3365762 RepID=UPI0037FEEEEA